MGTYTDDNPNALYLNGYQTVFYDGFNGTELNRQAWPAVYGGPSNGNYTWSGADVNVGNGELAVTMTNHGGSWTAGGLNQSWAGSHTYGLFEVRAMVDKGQGTGPGIILWPTDDNWPPEVDLLETPNGDRSQVYFSNHWAGGGNNYASQNFNVDASQWHTYAVDWQPDHLTYLIDGKPMYTTTDHVPQTPMALGFMGFVAKSDDGWYGGGPNGSTPSQVGLHIDWVKISEPGGGGGIVATAPAAAASVAATVGATLAADGTDWNALAAAVLANHDATGLWTLPATLATAATDWYALAQQVYANHDATGHWFA